MRIKHTLIAQRDAETGELGLVIEGMRGMSGEVNSATEGLLIAHDMIEHVNGVERIGSIDDELEALGAIYYVRGQHGQLNRNGVGAMYTIEENISGDVVRMYRDHACGAYVSYDVRRMPRAVEHDEALQDVLRYAESNYLGEFDTDMKAHARKHWPAYARLALARMRVGYRKARRKWEKLGRYAANNAFWAIADATQSACKSPEFEGMRYELSYDSSTGDAFCVETVEKIARGEPL